MDYTAGFVAMQVHDVNLRTAEQRIAIERAAAERAELEDGGSAPASARGPWLRFARRGRRHTALVAR